MSQQFSSPRFAAQRKIDRLFFAVFPDVLTAGRIENLVQRLRAQPGVKGRTLARNRFHISLYHVGDYAGIPQDVVAMAGQAAATITTPAFQVGLDSVLSFSGKTADNRPLVLRSSIDLAELRVLQKTLRLAMEKVELGREGERHPESRFNPHLTLLYGDHHIEQTIDPITWPVREFVLVHSLVGRTRYVHLMRWPLRT